MKKYAQITIILGLFFGLVWWRDHSPNSDRQLVVSLPATTPTATNPSLANSSATSPTSTSTNNQVSAPAASSAPATGRYKDGTYNGLVADAFYGNVQVQVKVSGGNITDVIFLQHPNDNGTSQRINNQAMPLLKQEALQAQSANIDGVTGASATSGAFIQSLGSALQKAA